ncbi:MAG: presenilin family intramembrane aspartyl protease [Candidatus Aenigmarchaeota archaeon]|nr:presenilin family intramembrane aspartyl protease [Candidatus Aenigmarchaeota archaeon]MDW8159946.1 presenilin family intramembrane aspartyl protease [Candidatus Aenigmarchaeota archaeon]
MKEAVIISVFFLLVALFSLYLGGITREAMEKGMIEPVFESPDDYRNVVFVFFLIILGTLLVLFFIKVKIEIVKILENISVFFLTTTTFSYFLPFFLSLIVSSFLVVLSEIRRSYWIKNFLLFLSIPSASAIFGSSLAPQVVFLLFLVLSVYDLLSVYFTGHMVYLAEKLVKKPTAFISVFPARNVRRIIFKKGGKGVKLKIFALGAGDYFLPSCFAVSLLSIGLKTSIFVVLTTTLSIFIMFYVLGRRDFSKPLPALPFLLLSSILGFVLSFYL